MQQSALNLIAIAIFTLTFSSLLAPILHIPLALPAGVTVALLGLTTVDTLLWESRGVKLLLDATASAEQRDRILRHEAGHFLAAYWLGIPVTGYTLTAWEALRQGHSGRGGVAFDTAALEYSRTDFSLILDRYCTVWMAGIAAEECIDGKAQGGNEDRQKLYRALSMAGYSELVCRQKERWAKQQATALLERHATAYAALVEAMKARATIEECYQTIQKYG